MPELATAWVTLTISARNARRDIQRELDGVDGGAAGRRAGQRFSAGVAGATNLTAVERQMVAAGQRAGTAAGKALGVGLKAGAAAGVAAVGTSIKLGADRLLAIDDARGKLKGLGHDAASQAKIMDSALASVKGTAFGLGDAATISASAVAAGIKPGAELTKYLKSTADAATIAGSSLSEMGSIFNKVQTGQSAMTDDLNMLADRGVPIYQWVAKEMGISASAVKTAAEKGKIDSATFFRAINSNIAGAALESGKTVRGSFNNMKAAVSRFGAALDEPTFKRAPATFGAITKAIDEATPAAGRFAQSLDSKMFDEWVPAAQRAWRELSANPVVRSNMAEVGQVVSSIGMTAQQVWPAIAQIGSSLGKASAALGVSTWQLFLTTLEAAAGVANMLVGPLQSIAGFMSSHQGVVTAAVGAWLLFRTVPAIMGRVSGSVSTAATAAQRFGAATTGQNLAGFRASMAAIVGDYRNIGTAAQNSGRQVSTWSQTMRALSNNSQTIRNMGNAFAGAATPVGAFSSALRAGAAPAIAGVQRAASGVIGALGGPWGAAFAAAGIAAALIISKNQKSAQSMEAVQKAAASAAEAQIKLNAALIKSRGAYDDEVASNAADRIGEFRQQLEAAASREGSFLDQFRAEGQSIFSWDSMIGYDGKNQADAIKDQASEAKAAQEALRGLGLTQQELADRTYGSAGAFEAMIRQLDATTPGGKRAAAGLRDARAEYLKTQEAAQRSTPGISEMAKAMQVLGDKTSTAANRTAALKAAIDALNPARSKGEAIAQHDKVLQQVAASTQEATDQTKGFGRALLDAQLGVSTSTENGQKLRESLIGMVDASSAAVASGQDINDVMAKNGPLLQQLAAQYGVTVEEITAAFNTLGGKDLNLTARLSGAPETVQQIGQIARAMQDAKIGEKKFIPITVDDKAISALKAIDIEVTRLPGNKGIEVVAKTEAARAQLANVTQILTALPPGKAIDVSAPGGRAVVDLLRAANIEVTSHNGKDIEVSAPNAPGVKALLEALNLTVRSDNGKNILVTQSGLEGVQEQVRKFLDAPAVKTVSVVGTGLSVSTDSRGNRGAVPDRAIGAIVPMANGGFRRISKPSTAGIYAGRGAGTIFAERETGGEAYVPLAPGKRKRSTAILGETARLFGLQLIRPGDFFQSFANGGLRPGAATLKDVISSKFGISDIGGYRPEDGYGEHSSGRALDVMVGSDKSKGDAVTSFVMANASRLGLKWAIWQQAMHYPDGRVVPMADRGSPTQNHMDHVHIFLDESSDKADLSSLGGSSVGAALEGIGDDSGGSGGGSSETQPAGSYGGGGFGRLGTAIAEALFGPRSGGSGGGSGGSGSGSGSGSPSSASASKTAAAQAASAKKVREAQDKADDAEKKIAVEEQKLKELEAKPKTKASALQAQRDRVEKAKRDAAQAKDDLATSKTAAEKSTAGTTGEKVVAAAQAKAEAAERSAAEARAQQAKIEADPKATASAKLAAKNRVEKTERDAEQAKTALKEAKKTGDKAKATKDGSGDSSDTSEFQSLGQNLVSGMFQAIGLDGSLFSNPFEWPNVKSAFALLNWGGGLAKSLSGSDSEDMGGLVGGAGAGLGLNIPNLADLAKPQSPQAPIGPGGALPLQGGGVTYDFRGANLGVNPKEMTQRIDSRQNAAFRRQSGALV